MAHTWNGPSHPPHATPGGDARRLFVALAITVIAAIVELIGGLATGSLALLADAGHVFTDVGALSLALVALRVAARPHTWRWTFGFHRVEVVAASLNALALLLVAALITWRAIERLRTPTEVEGSGLLAVALFGLAANLVALLVLHGSLAINVRAARLHVLSDLGGSLAAVAAGVLTIATGEERADPLLSLLIVALVVWGALRLLRETGQILMDRVPPGIDLAAITAELEAIPGVVAAHDVHCWTITTGFVAFACHLQTTPTSDAGLVVERAGTLLRERWGIAHATVQPEPMPLLTPRPESLTGD